MKTASERVKARLKKRKQMVTISLRMPEDVIDGLKELAPSLGFSGYQPLMRAYVGQGMRRDQARVDAVQLQALTDSLRCQGVAERTISAAVAQSKAKLG